MSCKLIIFWFYLSTFMSVATLTQALGSSDFTLTDSLAVTGNAMHVDHTGNIYVIHKNQLIKYNKDLNKTAEFSNGFLGNITTVDVSDPFRILLYYKDHNRIVFLDNFLASLGEPILLDNLGLYNVEAVCASAQGGFWLFNNTRKRLQYYDRNLRQVRESISLNNLIQEVHKPPDYLIEKNNLLYLYIPGYGLLVFDRFGAYSTIIPVETDNHLQISTRQIIFVKNNRPGFYDFQNHVITKFPINLSGKIISANLVLNKLYIFDGKMLRVYLMQ